jgi:hypothetical protein
MKKLLSIVLLLVYGLSSSGMSVTVHYCCGKFDKISFSSKYDAGCKPGKLASKKGCCDNKEVNFKLKADQEPTPVKQVSSFCQDNLIPGAADISSDLVVRNTPVAEYSTGPPLSPPALFITNCVFRI